MQMALTVEQKHQLITKAVQDETFRAALQRDARATIAQALQVPLPPEVTIHVRAPAAHEVCLVLPPYPADWPPGLSVDALEQRLTAATGQLEAGPQTVARGQARLVAKAWHDARFKQALLQDPKEVIRREFGEGLPAEVAVQVVAEDAHTQYLVLPPALDDLELSDEQLEQVAGGEMFTTLFLFATLAVASAGGGMVVTAAVSTGVKSGW
jgi:hypothetical protein